MATPTLAVDLAVKLDLKYVDSDDMNEKRGDFLWQVIDALTSGTGSDQSDLLFWDTRTLTATSENLDLAGSLSDVFDNTLTFVKIKAIVIQNTSTTATENLAVGGAASNQFINWVANSSDIVNIGPSGIFVLWSPIDGYAVTAATGDLLKIDAGSDTITYKIVLIGTSA
jgi:hypothetical protein